MKTGLLYGIVANSKTRVRCVFCGVYIPKANKCIEEHTNGTKHKENIEQMAENGISFNHDDDQLYCKPCNIHLGEEESIPSHLECDTHANWMAAMDDLVEGEFINIDAYLGGESEDVFCEVCNCKITCVLHNIEEHVNDILHRSNVAEKLKPSNGIFPSDKDDELWCKVCNESIENTARSLLSHIDDNFLHVTWLLEMQDLIESHEISVQDYLKCKDEQNAYCNRCQVEIPCTFQSIEDHIANGSIKRMS